MVMCPMMYLHCYKVGPLVQEVIDNLMLEVLSEVMLTENCSQKRQTITGICGSPNLGELYLFQNGKGFNVINFIASGWLVSSTEIAILKTQCWSLLPES